MDVHGNPTDRNIWGESTHTDAWGNFGNSDVHGNPPTDVWGGYSPDGGHDGGVIDAAIDFFGNLFGG